MPPLWSLAHAALTWHISPLDVGRHIWRVTIVDNCNGSNPQTASILGIYQPPFIAETSVTSIRTVNLGKLRGDIFKISGKCRTRLYSVFFSIVVTIEHARGTYRSELYIQVGYPDVPRVMRRMPRKINHQSAPPKRGLDGHF